MSVLANDSVIGDPLFSVPMTLADPEDLQLLPSRVRGLTPHLCFQVHGEPDTHFNLLSDTCVSVNALYQSVQSDFPSGFHVITEIGISATDDAARCIFVQVGVANECAPIMRTSDLDGDGVLDPVEVTEYDSRGVSVSLRRRGLVRVAVPNCNGQRLVMYLSCVTTTGDTPVVRFDITRGINLSPTSHGLLGMYVHVRI